MKIVESFDGVSLPVVEGWEWVVNNYGILVARTTDNPRSPPEELSVVGDDVAIDPSWNDGMFYVPVAIMKALLEANRG